MAALTKPGLSTRASRMSPSSSRIPQRGVATKAAREPGSSMNGLSQTQRTRVRRSSKNKRQQSTERKKMDDDRKRRASWGALDEAVLAPDTSATLSAIEVAQQKVEQALSEEFRDNSSINELRTQLQELKGELEMARKRLQDTQDVVAANEKQVAELQHEAEKLRSLVTVETPHPVTAMSASTAAPPRPTRIAETGSPATPVTTPVPREASSKHANRDMLRSTLEIEEGLKDYWYPVEFSSSLKDKDTLIPLELFNETFVLFRDENGHPSCVVDECAHRACPLSLGSVVDGRIQCPYHGWEYNRQGQCTKMPSTAFCRGIQVQPLEVQEKDGLIWVWAGESKPFREIPDIGYLPEGYTILSEVVFEVPVEHGLLVENLLDMAHAPFTHTSTFAKGWKIPDAVKFRMTGMLGGEWDPYPVEMSFQPPCMALSIIGLQRPGKVEKGVRLADCKKHLRQMHACLPSRPGHTRLLYRMCLDFLPIIRILKKLPFMGWVMKQRARRVVEEDLVLVQGQQRRMLRGGNTWANPVSYDKLAVRYRRWRNSLQSTDQEEREEAEAALGDKMSAGELFSIMQEGQR